MTAAIVLAVVLAVLAAETVWGGPRLISKTTSVLGLGFFGVLEVLSLIAIASPDRLEISPSGVFVRHLWIVHRLGWDQLSAFRLVRSAYPGSAKRIVGISAVGARLDHKSPRLTNPKWELPTAEVLAMLEEGRARWGLSPVVASEEASSSAAPVILGDRISRGSYWIFVAVALAFVVAVSLLPQSSWTGGVLVGALVVVSRGRLHDIGLSAWWSAGVIPVNIAFGLAVSNLPYLQYSLLHGVSLGAAGLLVGLALALGAVTWLGAKPGDPAENRYGVAPAARPRLIF